MNIETKITLDMLTEDSVSVLTQKFVEGEQLGGNHRRAFVNSESDRVNIKEYLADYPNSLKAVMEVWGKTPTVSDPEPKVEE